MRKFFFVTWVYLIFTLINVSALETKQQTGKLLEFGWDMPDVPFLVKNLKRLDNLPFDGVVIDLGRRNKWSGSPVRKLGFAWSAWQKKKSSKELITRMNSDIKLLSQVKNDALKDCFIQFNANPGGVNWYDEDGIKNVINNWRTIAKAVKLSRVKGIFFDIEYYAKIKGPGWQPCIWSYKDMSSKNKYSYKEYQEQVYKQSLKIIKVIREECPKMTIIFTFGNELLYGTNKRGAVFKRHSLLPAFIDGFLKGAGENITIVDGYEQAYGFKDSVSFKSARNIVEHVSYFSRLPELYKDKMHMGFGLFIDVYARTAWHTRPDEFKKNFYTPDELAYAVQQGLKYGDYVWIYTQKINWWKGEFCPEEYIQALKKAKKKVLTPSKKHSIRKSPKHKPTYATARRYIKQDDYHITTPLWEKYRLVLTLPVQWKFKTDIAQCGEVKKWYSKSTNISDWQNIIVPEWWNCKGSKWENYSGVAWYRVNFRIPKWTNGRKMTLLFTGVDEEAKIWLNGKFVGEHNLASAGWDVPFLFDVSKYVDTKKVNSLTVRVNGGDAYGGIWRSVYLITPIAKLKSNIYLYQNAK